jgi:hypothetical protein
MDAGSDDQHWDLTASRAGVAVLPEIRLQTVAVPTMVRQYKESGTVTVLGVGLNPLPEPHQWSVHCLDTVRISNRIFVIVTGPVHLVHIRHDEPSGIRHHPVLHLIDDLGIIIPRLPRAEWVREIEILSRELGATERVMSLSETLQVCGVAAEQRG